MMKDLIIGAILARGQSKNNVYQWPSLGDTSYKQTLIGIKTSLASWHEYLKQ